MVTRLSALFCAVFIALLTAACGGGKASEDEDVAPDVRFDKLEFQVFRGPELTASGSAAAARLRRDTNELAVESIRVHFPASPGREAAVVRAARGHGNLAQRWFEVEGGVEAVQGDDTATTDRARYAKADGVVRGDAPVSLQGPDYQLTGPGFTLDPRSRTVRVDGGARIRAEGAAP